MQAESTSVDSVQISVPQEFSWFDSAKTACIFCFILSIFLCTLYDAKFFLFFHKNVQDPKNTWKEYYI